MTTEVQLNHEESIKRRFGTVADDARVARTGAALEANGIRVLRASSPAEAKRIVLDLIPDGSQVHSGASQSLEVSGIIDEIQRSPATTPFDHGSGAWTATPRPTRSAACPRRRT